MAKCILHTAQGLKAFLEITSLCLLEKGGWWTQPANRPRLHLWGVKVLYSQHGPAGLPSKCLTPSRSRSPRCRIPIQHRICWDLQDAQALRDTCNLRRETKEVFGHKVVLKNTGFPIAPDAWSEVMKASTPAKRVDHPWRSASRQRKIISFNHIGFFLGLGRGSNKFALLGSNPELQSPSRQMHRGANFSVDKTYALD